MSQPRALIPPTLALSACIAALLTTARLAASDVTVETKTTTSGMGGFGSGTSTSTLVIADDKSRSEDEYTYTGRFKTIAGGGKPQHSTTITRIDRELMWRLNDDKKQYTEKTFEEMRKAMEEGAAAAEDAQAEAQKPKDVDMDFKVDVQPTGKKETINGFATEQVIVTLTGTAKDKKSGEAGSMKLTMDEWLSQAVPGQDEVKAYGRRLADKLGLDPEVQRMGRMAMSMYGNAMRKVSGELKELKGYPVRSTMRILTGAELTPEQQAKVKEGKEEAAKARADAAKQSERAEKVEDVQSAAEAGSQAKSGNMGGAVSGFLARKLAHSMEKKAQKAAEKQAAEAGDASSGGGGFTVTTELMSARVGPATVGFDVPAGYTKVEEKQPKAGKPEPKAHGK